MITVRNLKMYKDLRKIAAGQKAYGKAKDYMESMKKTARDRVSNYAISLKDGYLLIAWVGVNRFVSMFGAKVEENGIVLDGEKDKVYDMLAGLSGKYSGEQLDEEVYEYLESMQDTHQIADYKFDIDDGYLAVAWINFDKKAYLFSTKL